MRKMGQKERLDGSLDIGMSYFSELVTQVCRHT